MSTETDASPPSAIARHAGLILVLLAFIAVTLAYGLVTPLGEGPDEVAHVDLIQFIGQHGHLPLTWEEREAAGRKSQWPMTYHAMVSCVTRWVDTGPLPRLKIHDTSLRRLLADDAQSPLTLVHAEDESFPFQGIALVWHLARLVSTLLSTATLMVVYLVSLTTWPDRRLRAAGITAVLAAIPQFQIISSSVNDDNLLGLLMALFGLCLVRAWRQPLRLAPYAWMGVWLGLAIATKYSVVLMPVVVVLALVLASCDHKLAWREGIKRFLVFAATTVLGCGWWFVYLEAAFNRIGQLGLLAGLLAPLVGTGADRTSLHLASLLTAGGIPSAVESSATAAGFGDWGASLFLSFWLVVGKLHLTAGKGFYVVFGVISLIATAGIVSLLATRRPAPNHCDGVPRELLWFPVVQIALLLAFPFVRFLVTRNSWETGQGRHVLFPAAFGVALLLALGVSRWMPKQWRRYRGFGLALLLLILSLAGMFGTILPQIPPRLPVTTVTTALDRLPNRMDLDVGGFFYLAGYQVEEATGDGALPVTLWWQSTAHADQDYLVDLRLVDEEGSLHSVWLGHPTNGRYPTRAWEPGEIVRDMVFLPLTGVSPGRYRLDLRVISMLDAGTSGHTPFGLTDLPAIATVSLRNVDIASKTPKNQTLTRDHPFVWQAGRPVTNGGTFAPRSTIHIQGVAPEQSDSVHLVGPDDQPRRPLAVAAGSALFLVGGDWPSGVYRFCRDSACNEANLPTLAVKTRPRNFKEPSPAQPLEAAFGDQLLLRGFDLPVRALGSGSPLHLFLHWEGLRTMGDDYRVAVKLLNLADGSSGRQLDRIPQGHYSTLLWVPEEFVSDEFDVPPAAGATGIYRLEVGVYREVDGQAEHLLLALGGEQQATNMVTLRLVKIGGPPSGVVVADPRPQHARHDSLGEVITLIGYDLAQTAEALNLVLYWHCDTPPASDYTTFVHVRTEQEPATGNVVAQMDSPPAAGAYPTSLWEPGEVVRDRISVPLPPGLTLEGCEVVVGLYDPVTGARLPVPGTKDNSIVLEVSAR